MDNKGNYIWLLESYRSNLLQRHEISTFELGLLLYLLKIQSLRKALRDPSPIYSDRKIHLSNMLGATICAANRFIKGGAIGFEEKRKCHIERVDFILSLIRDESNDNLISIEIDVLNALNKC